MIDFSAFNNISDELLAAYIDGNTTADENTLIQESIVSDELLSEVVDIVNDSISFGSYNWSIHDGDYGFLELGIDPVFTYEELFSEVEMGVEDNSCFAIDSSLSDECLDIEEPGSVDDWNEADDMNDIFGN